MKKAIFTLAVGDSPMYRAAIMSFQRYADRVGAELVVGRELHYPITLEKPRHTASVAWTEKLYIGELLKTYGRVLYLDADIIVMPHARDIFSVYPDPSKLYALNEGQLLPRQGVIDKIEAIMGPLENWPHDGGLPVYYNVGCLLVSRGHPLFEHANLEDLQRLCNHIQYYEQTYFNYLLHREGMGHESITPEFNRMDAWGEAGFSDASFVHYAGRGYTNSSLKREARFARDFAEFFAGIIEPDVLASIREAGWAQFVDKAAHRYRMPRALINALASRLVRL